MNRCRSGSWAAATTSSTSASAISRRRTPPPSSPGTGKSIGGGLTRVRGWLVALGCAVEHQLVDQRAVGDRIAGSRGSRRRCSAPAAPRSASSRAVERRAAGAAPRSASRGSAARRGARSSRRPAPTPNASAARTGNSNAIASRIERGIDSRSEGRAKASASSYQRPVSDGHRHDLESARRPRPSGRPPREAPASTACRDRRPGRAERRGTRPRPGAQGERQGPAWALRGSKVPTQTKSRSEARGRARLAAARDRGAGRSAASSARCDPVVDPDQAVRVAGVAAVEVARSLRPRTRAGRRLEGRRGSAHAGGRRTAASSCTAGARPGRSRGSPRTSGIPSRVGEVDPGEDEGRVRRAPGRARTGSRAGSSSRIRDS